MVYFTIRSGYRSGGINTQAVNPAVYGGAAGRGASTSKLGMKSDWSLWGMPVRTNFDGYSTAYHNIQAQRPCPMSRWPPGRAAWALHPGDVQRRPVPAPSNANCHLQCAQARASMAWNGTSPRCPFRS